MSVALEATGIKKSFGRGDTRIDVLRNVDLTANAGEITFLVGPSGCGKTTLISVLAGMLKAEEGKVSMLGQRVDRLRGAKLTRFRGRNIGFIFQQFNLIPSLDVVENAALPLVVGGMSPRQAGKKALQLLEQLGLGNQARKFPQQLSGGQQQRVAVARALVHDPSMIVCDEPTSALDAISGHAVMELLRELTTTRDRVVIVVTHDDRIYSFADRIVEMCDGAIVKDTPQHRSSTGPAVAGASV